MELYRTALPMRSFQHAAASRDVAEAIVVRLITAAGRQGWGEALPREYVTGETLETVVRDIATIFWPILRDSRPADSPAQWLAQLPCVQGGRVMTAARCGAELAAIEAFGIRLGRGITPPPGWPRVTGVIGSRDPGRTARKLRLMRWYGLRDFKLKLGLGDEIDQANLRAVHKRLAKGLAAGRFSLRADANGAWTYAEAPERVAQLKALGFCAVEQPCSLKPPRFVDLAYKCDLPLIADESCLTESDAEILLGGEARVWLNLRIAKNGGLGPTLRLAQQADRDHATFVLGCMVGESAILSGAQRALLTLGPTPSYLEGNYGHFLLKADLASPSPRFGFRGILHPPSTGPSAVGHLAPEVDGRLLRRFGQLVATLE